MKVFVDGGDFLLTIIDSGRSTVVQRYKTNMCSVHGKLMFTNKCVVERNGKTKMLMFDDNSRTNVWCNLNWDEKRLTVSN